MPPHITEYFDFVEDKTLFLYCQNGDIIIDPRMSTTIARLYIVVNWEKLLAKGNSASVLWHAVNALRGDNLPLRFNKEGYQISKLPLLDLDAPYFMGVYGESFGHRYYNIFLRLAFYLIMIVLGWYLVQSKFFEDLNWSALLSLTQQNVFQ